MPPPSGHAVQPMPRVRNLAPRVDQFQRGYAQMSRSVSHEGAWAPVIATRVGVVQPQLKQPTVEPAVITADVVTTPEVLKQSILGGPPNFRLMRDPWSPDIEQKKYYIDEFVKLSNDPNGWVAGDVARNFFFKSKLPTIELSHIWELSDLDKDGRLTLQEFAIAFHLTSLRRHGYQLPMSLPETLLIEVVDMFSDLYTPVADIEVGEGIISEDCVPLGPEDENWETFSERSFSTVSSANTLPNFAANVKDGEHLHVPVPLRMTPNSMAARSKALPAEDEPIIETATEVFTKSTDVKILPPPFGTPNRSGGTIQAKRDMYFKYTKRKTENGSSSAPSTTTSSSSQTDSEIDLPPPSSSASCSSSRKILRNSSSDSDDNSPVETNSSTQENFADFKNFDRLVKSTESLEVSSTKSESHIETRSEASRKSKSLPRESSLSPGQTEHSAVTPVPISSAAPPLTESTSAPVAAQPEPEVDPAVRKLEQVRSMVNSLKERNARLDRLNQALSLELKDLIAERTSLETRLEKEKDKESKNS